MIILISGASHTGKTLLAQQLMEKYQYPYLSLDLLKMGLIRSGQTELTPEDDQELKGYLWPIAREMIKTAIENQQHLIVEGFYISFDWKKDFAEEYLAEIKFYCLILSEAYIEQHFDAIKQHANAIEQRLDDSALTKAAVLADNAYHLAMCQKYDCEYLLVEDGYQWNIE